MCLQTVCYPAPKKSLSERNYIQERQRRGKRSFPVNILTSIIHQAESPGRPHTWICIKSATKISHRNYFPSGWENWFITSWTIPNVLSLFLKFFWRRSQNSFGKELNKHKFNLLKKKKKGGTSTESNMLLTAPGWSRLWFPTCVLHCLVSSCCFTEWRWWR